MTCRWLYHTPDGMADLVLESDGEFLTGVRFAASAKVSDSSGTKTQLLPVFKQAIRWLDEYFSGHAPDVLPPYRISGLTDFRRDVISVLLSIPYGQTMTYGEIAGLLAKRRGIDRMSAQAVGGAVGWNPLCILIPCHRVVGSSRRLTGYGGGMENKIALLRGEGIDLTGWQI